MSTYRIEFRTYNVGADGALGPLGTGFAHNFLVLVEVLPNGDTRRIAELHGESRDPKTKALIGFDLSGRGQLEVKRYNDESHYYRDSENHPKFALFTGSEKEASERFAWAQREGNWITAQKFQYRLRTQNSNSATRTMARATGFDVTSQPMDRETGSEVPAPGRDLDLRDAAGRPRDPDEIIWMERINGYGIKEKDRRTAPPQREFPSYEAPGRALPRRGAAPAGGTPASYSLGFENARRFADEHRFDPRAEPALSVEQNRIISTWVERVLAPAVAHAQLPKALGGDVLDQAARATPHEAGLALQQGLNRLAGAPEFGRTPPAFADGAAKRVTEDGWIGPETLAATEKHAAERGLGKVREAVALAAFQRGLDGLAKGNVGADEAPAVFRRSVGRLYGDPDARPEGGFALPRPTWASASTPRHKAVAALQESINDANRVFAFADEPLEVDGDLGPKTSAGLVSAARAAGSERLTDHLGKRLGIGEPGLIGNRARGFDYALENDEQERADTWDTLA